MRTRGGDKFYLIMSIVLKKIKTPRLDKELELCVCVCGMVKVTFRHFPVSMTKFKPPRLLYLVYYLRDMKL